LPDNINIRRRIGQRFGVSPSDSFALLREVGRDCIGALQLLEDEDEAALPGPPQGITLSEYALADYFDSVLSGGPLLHQDNPDDFRISLAALHSVENEWLCSSIVIGKATFYCAFRKRICVRHLVCPRI
jgi:serine/threonine protein kinase HipA of HipAB toxin-antitoxin module